MVVMDGAPCHSENTMQVPDNITIIKIPPYSPQLNPAEQLWKYLRTNFFANRLFDSIDDLIDYLADKLNYMAEDKSIIKSMTKYHWI